MNVNMNPQVSFNNPQMTRMNKQISFDGHCIKYPARKAFSKVEKRGLIQIITPVLALLGLKQALKTGNDELDRTVSNEIDFSARGSVLRTCSLEKMKDINTKLEKYPHILKKIYLKKDNDGKNIIYNANEEKMKEIHRVFKDDPKVLEKMHLSKNKKGKIKAHNATLNELREIHNVFADNNEVLAKIHLTKNKKGALPVHYMGKEGVDLVLNQFSLEPKTLAKIFSEPNKFRNKEVLEFIKHNLVLIDSIDSTHSNHIRDILKEYSE